MTTKKPASSRVKKINLALQGGGAQGAFTWGVLDELLNDERVDIEAISCTSAGAVNAVVMADGLLKSGPKEARKRLEQFWKKVSLAASMMPFRPTIIDKMLGNVGLDFSPSFLALDYLTRMFSPYQFNLFDINPLRAIVGEMVDFEALRGSDQIKLFINATNVRTGRIKLFDHQKLTLDMVMASACLPHIFKTVEVDGEPYWDGGYSGNPAIYPLIHQADSADVLIVQINPLYVEEPPTKASDILDRINEISFNSTLLREMREIAFVNKLVAEGQLASAKYKEMHIHMIEAQEILNCLGRASKLNADWDFLLHLRDIGAQAARDWLDKNYEKIGVESTVDMRKEFL